MLVLYLASSASDHVLSCLLRVCVCVCVVVEDMGMMVVIAATGRV